MLPDGEVVVAGGGSNKKTSYFDPATDSWSPGEDMNVPRGYQGSKFTKYTLALTSPTYACTNVLLNCNTGTQIPYYPMVTFSRSEVRGPVDKEAKLVKSGITKLGHGR